MRILLVDDNARHRRAGVQQLEALGHEVIACSGYAEAHRLANDNHFEIALIDLLMPAEPMMLGTNARIDHVGREIAIGFPLALALAMTGVLHVFVVTDVNHHDHPMSAAVDWFEGRDLTINGADVRIMYAHLTADGAKDWGKALVSLA